VYLAGNAPEMISKRNLRRTASFSEQVLSVFFGSESLLPANVTIELPPQGGGTVGK
jgi:hypothetical protein